jgi:hypothetical protein
VAIRIVRRYRSKTVPRSTATRPPSRRCTPASRQFACGSSTTTSSVPAVGSQAANGSPVATATRSINDSVSPLRFRSLSASVAFDRRFGRVWFPIRSPIRSRLVPDSIADSVVFVGRRAIRRSAAASRPHRGPLRFRSVGRRCVVHGAGESPRVRVRDGPVVGGMRRGLGCRPLRRGSRGRRVSCVAVVLPASYVSDCLPHSNTLGLHPSGVDACRRFWWQSWGSFGIASHSAERTRHRPEFAREVREERAREPTASTPECVREGGGRVREDALAVPEEDAVGIQVAEDVRRRREP